MSATILYHKTNFWYQKVKSTLWYQNIFFISENELLISNNIWSETITAILIRTLDTKFKYDSSDIGINFEIFYIRKLFLVSKNWITDWYQKLFFNTTKTQHAHHIINELLLYNYLTCGLFRLYKSQLLQLIVSWKWFFLGAWWYTFNSFVFW